MPKYITLSSVFNKPIVVDANKIAVMEIYTKEKGTYSESESRRIIKLHHREAKRLSEYQQSFSSINEGKTFTILLNKNGDILCLVNETPAAILNVINGGIN